MDTLQVIENHMQENRNSIKRCNIEIELLQGKIQQLILSNGDLENILDSLKAKEEET